MSASWVAFSFWAYVAFFQNSDADSSSSSNDRATPLTICARRTLARFSNSPSTREVVDTRVQAHAALHDLAQAEIPFELSMLLALRSLVSNDHSAIPIRAVDTNTPSKDQRTTGNRLSQRVRIC